MLDTVTTGLCFKTLFPELFTLEEPIKAIFLSPRTQNYANFYRPETFDSWNVSQLLLNCQ